MTEQHTTDAAAPAAGPDLAAEPTAEPTAGPTAGPTAEAAPGPVAEPSAEPDPASAPEPVLEPAAEPVPAAPKDRRKLFAVLRWTAAVLVFAAVGAGTAYGVVQPERTRIPGLSTLSDGRWTYPELAKPELPAGASLPGGPDNKDGKHYAALTSLLLPVPGGAKPDDTVKADKDGKVAPDSFLEEYAPEDRAKLKESFEFEGLRQITGRSWTMPDGTRARVYLLRFHSSGFVDTFPGCGTGTRLTGADALMVDLSWSKAKTEQYSNIGSDGFGSSGTLSTSDISLYEEAKPFGDEQVRLGCLQVGDVQGVIIQSRKGGAATIPFHQTVILQSQLLS
ncbi:PT domain-containing protein [Streptomyces sp. NPDC059193]|uniref:PT domain-containing protein n=1 Tax=Streptomyces sp. NPDC059193 TaxID=3346763 RepID=UPI00368170D7